MVFRLAPLFYNLLLHGSLPYDDVFGLLIIGIVMDSTLWVYWWLQLLILQLLYYCGQALAPYYTILAPYFDVQYKSTGLLPYWKTSLAQHALLTVDSRLMILSDVINICSSSLAYLRHKLKSSLNSFVDRITASWNKKREMIGDFPPLGWPLKLSMVLFATGSIIIILISGYFKILKEVWKSNKPNLKGTKLTKRLTSVYNSVSDETIKLKSELFDSDSETAIMDNSANCIIMKRKSSFIPSTYIEIDPNKFYGITTAIGTGNPVGIGDVKIGWHDDMGKYHNFVLKDAFHIPDSAVNVIGISELSKNIGDFKSKGTRIDSSGQDSILTWDNKQFMRSFIHSESCLPEMPINDGYSKFHRLCNLIDKIHPVDRQCYHNDFRRRRDAVRPIPPKEVLQSCPYDVGEEVLYKNKDHVEKGIIEGIKLLDYSNTPEITVKFRDTRKATAHPDQISTSEETDAADIPISPQEFLENAIHLSEDDLQKLKNPNQLTDLEIK